VIAIAARNRAASPRHNGVDYHAAAVKQGVRDSSRVGRQRVTTAIGIFTRSRCGARAVPFKLKDWKCSRSSRSRRERSRSEKRPDCTGFRPVRSERQPRAQRRRLDAWSSAHGMEVVNPALTKTGR